MLVTRSAYMVNSSRVKVGEYERLRNEANQRQLLDPVSTDSA